MQASEPISSSLQIFSALAVTLSGHRSLAKVTMMDPSGGVLEPCAGCRVLKKREEYSNRQWKRRTTRFCKSCVNIQEKKLREVEKARKESRNPCHAPAPLQHAKSSEAKSDGEPFGGKFSIAELQTCIKVVAALGQDSELYSSRPLKGFRTALIPLIRIQQPKLFQGLSRDELDSRKRKRVGKLRQMMADRAHDRNLVNKRELRSKRLAKLSEVSGRSNLPLIPDGFVDETEATRETGMLLLDEQKKEQNETAMAITGTESELKGQPRSCYLCKKRFRKLHKFYDQFCPPCADLNWKKRVQTANLNGYMALITGARVKIGYRTALKLLRCGAAVIATTRFPVDASKRYRAEKDFKLWGHRLQIVGLDFRNIRAVEAFCADLIANAPRLDIIINNACQTIRRPPAYYSHLLSAERVKNVDEAGAQLLRYHTTFTGRRLGVLRKSLESDSGNDCKGSKDSTSAQINKSGSINVISQPTEWSEQTSKPVSNPTTTSSISADVGEETKDKNVFNWLPSHEMTQIAVTSEDKESVDLSLYPKAHLDVNKQQIDLRKRNSWLLRLEEVDTAEAAEVLMINSLAPFVINSKLKPLMEASEPIQGGEASGKTLHAKFIINVSAMEGKFYRHKSVNHPHTNMAKAALNMMTRTSAADYAESYIFMNAVDTGWINDENPLEKANKIAKEHNFQTPIDEVDAAARILDPVMIGVNKGTLLFGKFLKDYAPTEW